MEPTPHRRSKLGPYFSEGARLLWLAMLERELWMGELRRMLSAHTGEVPRVLYGARKANVRFVAKASEVFGIDPASWLEETREDFRPPWAPPKRARRGAQPIARAS